MEIREIASAEEQMTHGLQNMTSKGETQQKHTDHSETGKKEKALNILSPKDFNLVENVGLPRLVLVPLRL